MIIKKEWLHRHWPTADIKIRLIGNVFVTDHPSLQSALIYMIANMIDHEMLPRSFKRLGDGRWETSMILTKLPKPHSSIYNSEGCYCNCGECEINDDK